MDNIVIDDDGNVFVVDSSGMGICYYEENPQLGIYIKQSFVDGIKNGSCQVYYYGGGIKEEGTYKNNVRNGSFRTYFNDEDNSIKTKANFLNGIIDGPFEYYYKSGKLFKKANFKLGVLNGFCEDYYVDGTIHKMSNFNNGKLSGWVYEFYPDGVLKSRKEYQDGMKIDKEYVYDLFGELDNIAHIYPISEDNFISLDIKNNIITMNDDVYTIKDFLGNLLYPDSESINHEVFGNTNHFVPILEFLKKYNVIEKYYEEVFVKSIGFK